MVGHSRFRLLLALSCGGRAFVCYSRSRWLLALLFAECLVIALSFATRAVVGHSHFPLVTCAFTWASRFRQQELLVSIGNHHESPVPFLVLSQAPSPRSLSIIGHHWLTLQIHHRYLAIDPRVTTVTTTVITNTITGNHRYHHRYHHLYGCR